MMEKKPTGHVALEQPSSWVTRFAPLIPPQREVLDLACGAGRHAKFLAMRGNPVLAVDRDAAALEKTAGSGIVTMQVDLESGDIPQSVGLFSADRFAAVVVTNYLHRPLFPHILESIAQQGVLIYETFAQGNERLGKPTNPAFLLAPGELLKWLRDDARNTWHVVAFEDGYVDLPRPARVQRICAVNGGIGALLPSLS